MAITNISFQVYTWGDGSMGQLGYKRTISYEPTLINQLSSKEIVKGSLGMDNSVCLSKQGTLFAFGSNSYGKLGVGSKNLSETFPIEIKGIKDVKKISLGQEHSGAITKNGDLFMWGSGYFGQLGTGEKENYNNPKMLTVIQNNLTIKFRKIKLGSFQSTAITEDGKYYLWGRGLFNLQPEKDKHIYIPEPLDFFKAEKKPKNIQAGHGNSIVLTINNEVYAFGDNRYYKAFQGEDKYIIKNPRVINFVSQENKTFSDQINIAIIKIYGNYDHCFALSASGELYGWGNPRLNRLTNSIDDEICKNPREISINWKEIQEDEMENNANTNEEKENVIN
jgi:alpha-tubulin suppressor-like RCC1 family protein